MSEAKPPPLVIDLCRTLVEATASGRSAYWLSVKGVREALAVTPEELDVALAYAIAADLVRTDGAPAHSLTVTYEGIELAKRGR
jgi:hypothetical protein